MPVFTAYPWFRPNRWGVNNYPQGNQPTECYSLQNYMNSMPTQHVCTHWS